MTATGLDDASVDGIMWVDAGQFATDTTAACREMRRLLRPGGRAALTNWLPAPFRVLAPRELGRGAGLDDAHRLVTGNCTSLVTAC